MASKAYPHGRRGFAAMSVEKQRAIARLGGKAAHAQGKAYEWDSHAASAAGRKGGAASLRARKARAGRA